MDRGRSKWLGRAFSVTVGALVMCTWAEAGASDLVILAITPSDPHPVVGEEISVAVLVENQGSGSAVDFDVALFDDSPVEPAVGSSASFSLRVASLSAGAKTTVIFAAVTSPVPGVWSSYVIVDNAEDVGESDETNNVAGPISVVWHASPYLGSGCSAGLHDGAAAGLAWSLVFPVLLAAFAFRRRAGVPVPRSGGRGSSGPRWI